MPSCIVIRPLFFHLLLLKQMPRPVKRTLPSTASKGREQTKQPKKNYILWETDQGGNDQLTSDQRLIRFLLEEDGKNLNILTVTSRQLKNRKRPSKPSKRELSRTCEQYFKEQGVTYRTDEDIRNRMKRLMESYSKAGAEFKKTGNGSFGDTEDSGSKAFESMIISKLCVMH